MTITYNGVTLLEGDGEIHSETIMDEDCVRPLYVKHTVVIRVPIDDTKTDAVTDGKTVEPDRP